jgi:hypothetical protein
MSAGEADKQVIEITPKKLKMGLDPSLDQGWRGSTREYLVYQISYILLST